MSDPAMAARPNFRRDLTRLHLFLCGVEPSYTMRRRFHSTLSAEMPRQARIHAASWNPPSAGGKIGRWTSLLPPKLDNRGDIELLWTLLYFAESDDERMESSPSSVRQTKVNLASREPSP